MAERRRGFNQLYYLKINGDIYQVNLQGGGASTSTKVYSSADLGLASSVEGMAIGPDGRLYRSDGINTDQIVRVEADGHATVVANGITELNGLTIDSDGNLFVSENLGLAGSDQPVPGRIVKIQPDGAQQVIAEVASPTSLAVDRDGVVYVVDGFTRVLKISPGAPAEVIAGDPQLDPVGLAVSPSGNLYISDSKNGTVWKRDSAGRLQQLVRSGLVPNPTYLAVNQREEVYVCQTGLDVLPMGLVGLQQALQVPVLIIDKTASIHRLGVRGDPAVLSTQDVAVAPSGDLYLNDGSGIRVVRAPVPAVAVESRALWRLELLLGAALVGLGLALSGSGLVLYLSRS